MQCVCLFSMCQKCKIFFKKSVSQSECLGIDEKVFSNCETKFQMGLLRGAKKYHLTSVGGGVYKKCYELCSPVFNWIHFDSCFRVSMHVVKTKIRWHLRKIACAKNNKL